EAARMDARELAGYKVVCLFQAVSVPEGLWKKLAGFVRAGGGLALVPAGGEWGSEARGAFTTHAARAGLLPATPQVLVSAPRGKSYPWAPFTGEHPLMAPFLKWTRTADPDFARPELRPLVRRFWRVAPADEKGVIVIAAYAAPSRPPALVGKELGKGRVILFTTPLDDRQLVPGNPASPRWHNYWQDSSFGLVLADRVCRYLAGEEAAPDPNGLCGQ